eukprot:248435_1
METAALMIIQAILIRHVTSICNRVDLFAQTASFPIGVCMGQSYQTSNYEVKYSSGIFLCVEGKVVQRVYNGTLNCDIGIYQQTQLNDTAFFECNADEPCPYTLQRVYALISGKGIECDRKNIVPNTYSEAAFVINKCKILEMSSEQSSKWECNSDGFEMNIYLDPACKLRNDSDSSIVKNGCQVSGIEENNYGYWETIYCPTTNNDDGNSDWKIYTGIGVTSAVLIVVAGFAGFKCGQKSSSKRGLIQ